MQLSFVISLLLHAGLLAWALLSISRTEQIVTPEVVPISVAIVTPSEMTRMKQGDQNTKTLESKADDKPSDDDASKEAAKPKAAPPPAAAPPPPPPPVETAKVEPPPPAPEPPKVEPPKPEPPPPDPIAEKLAALPPPPEPAPGPTPEELAAEAAKVEAAKQAAAAKAKADAAAKAKAEAAARAKAEAAKKAKAEAAAKAKAEAEKKKFDPNKLAELIDKAPDDGQPKALIDKSKKPAGAKPTGDSQTATNVGPSAGTKEGRDTVLSAREADMLASLIDSKLRGCWRLPAGGGGMQTPIVVLSWRLKQDGTLEGEPQVLQPQATPMFKLAAEAAVNAVKSCVPFQLPPDKYVNWRDIRSWSFDPSKML
jgi:colicin import membrane protein